MSEINNTEKKLPREPLQETDKNARIFYGDDASQNQFPFMVRLSVVAAWGMSGTGYANYTYSWTCGGSIIGPRHVLTAAHCVTSNPYDNSFGYTVEPYNVMVYIGDHKADSEDGEVLYRAESINAHPDYDYYEIVGDVAVITLNTDIAFSSTVRTIALPVTGDDALQAGGSAVTVAGWGVTEEGYLTDTLQYIEYQFMNFSDCTENWPSGWVTEGMVCTADDPDITKKTWAGDSGGPLFVGITGAANKVLGLVSWGTDDSSDNYYYDVNADVYFYRDWILEQMGRSKNIREEIETSADYIFTIEKYMNAFVYVYPADSSKYLKISINSSGLNSYDQVIVYDSMEGIVVANGSHLIAGIGQEHNGEVNSVWTAQGHGAVIRVEGTSLSSGFGTVNITVQAYNDQDSNNTVEFCADGFFTCTDLSYCVLESQICRNSSSYAYCQDGSDETCGCGMTDYCLDDKEDKDNKMYFLYDGEQMAMNLSHGVLVTLDDGEPYVVCNDGAGATTAATVCAHFGYSGGQIISPDDYLNEHTAEIPYGATHPDCPEGADSISECRYIDYMENGVPCFNGEQLAVSCSDKSWEFNAEISQIKYRTADKGTKVSGRAWCDVSADKYGMEIEDKSVIGTALANFNGTSVEWVNAEGKYVKKKDSWKLKIRKELSGGERKSDMCFVCIAWIEGAAFTYAVDTENCGVSYSEDTLAGVIYSAISN